MAAGFFRRFHHLFVSGLRPSKLDVVLYRIGKEVHLLEHHAHLIHQGFQGIVLHIDPAYTDDAAVHVPEPGNQVAQGRLARAAGPHNGRGGFVRDGDGNVLQNRLPVVGKIHVLKRDIVGFGMLRLALFVHLRDLIHLVGVVDGASYQTQGGYAAARGFDLRKDQESHNDRHQGIGEGDGPV